MRASRSAWMPSLCATGSAATRASRCPRTREDHCEAGDDGRQHDGDLVVEVMRHEHSNEEVDRGGKHQKEEAEPTQFDNDGRTRHHSCGDTRHDKRVPPRVRPMESTPTTVASQRCFEGCVFNVRVDTVRYDDGAEHRIDVVEHTLSLAIVATPSPNEIVLARQYRHPAGAVLWEIPAGTVEPDEAAIEGALRELREETGYVAGRIRPIGSIWTTPGFCSEKMQFFHADRLTAGAPSLDDDERIDVEIFSVEAAWRLVAEGTADAKTVLALFWMQVRERVFGSDFHDSY
jgi:ADP-ribose pyrophosphatase